MNERREQSGYSWQSKRELQIWFLKKHALSKATVEAEILLTKKNFQQRSAQIIDTRQLWQKTGNRMLQKYRAKNVSFL